ncbi:hypothetical protein PAESOLCIP111_03318 [Paenibacillus solanacearum]|uniref:Polymer-forming cytoskeletal protein n=1 Tax=Paenibacillus solanacearum TaxID=2048548 RepID=A0A916NQ90_9BACL|nr:bactofilin [Paenibacillus solanacearum]CAG7631633.1 hypothetical protein PAESOLCIP111_03318 [Paenibacillus solanacearum]
MVEQDNRRDLVISGSGTSGGGQYRDVKISGEGKVYGNVECNQFKTNGKSEVNGSVLARIAQINGLSVITGDLKAEEVRVFGDMKLEGSGKYGDFKCRGIARINGDLTGENLDLEGEMTVDGDCEAEVFCAKGAFEIEGLLNAGVVDITLYGSCRAKEIGGEMIKVGKRNGLRSLLYPFLPVLALKLTADVIEGDDIYLVNTKAKVVRGKRVTIGQGCEIELVEYKEQFEPHQGAKINESKQI